EPDMIGSSMVISTPTYPSSTDYLPPRKKWVDHWMRELDDLYPMVQEEISGVIFPPEDQEKVAPLMKSMQGFLDDSERHFNNLKSLTDGEPYDRDRITSETKAIEDDLTQLEKERKKLREVVAASKGA